jgi:F-type H+-transporting ATPase subunit delta
MKQLSGDAKEFVLGVLDYVKSEAKSPDTRAKVRSALNKVSADEQNRNVAFVETAIELSEKEFADLKKALEGLFKRTLEVKMNVKPELLGGMRISVGDWIYDATLSNQLYQLQSNLIESL